MLNAIKKDIGKLSLKKQNSSSVPSERKRILFFDESLKDAIIACQPKRIQHAMYK